MPCCPSAAFARDVISFGTALHGCALGRAWRHAGQMMQMLREETLRKRWGKGFGDHRKNGLFNHQNGELTSKEWSQESNMWTLQN